MADRDIDLQRAWDNRGLKGAWPGRRDHRFAVEAMLRVPVLVTAQGASGRVLEVAAAEAEHSCRLADRGLDCVVLEPSPAMLERARERMAAEGSYLTLVRGIAEGLPFADASFDRVLCESAIDHFQHPDESVREMARVLKPDGRLVISFVNYGSLSTRVSRILYRLWRRGAAPVPGHHEFWDSPVPIEHTFECTVPVLRTLCEPYLEIERLVGVSLGWGVPGWSRFLERLSEGTADRLLEMLHGAASRRPEIADYVVTVWRRRAHIPETRHGGLPIEILRVRPNDPAHRWRASVEAARSPLLAYASTDEETETLRRRLANRALTGDADRSWLDDLIARGPFERAAMLGCERVEDLTTWIRAGASRQLDVYEPGEQALATLREAARGAASGAARPVEVSFRQASLDYVELPAGAFDVVFAGGTLSRVVNLEYLYAQVGRALRPGGLFAFFDYVGERRLQYGSARLVRVNAALSEVPVRFRTAAENPVAPPPLSLLTPLCAVRSDELLSLAAERFETVAVRTTGALFPLFLSIDLGGLAREAPDVLDRVVAAEDAASLDPSLRPCGAYGLFQRSGSATQLE